MANINGTVQIKCKLCGGHLDYRVATDEDRYETTVPGLFGVSIPYRPYKSVEFKKHTKQADCILELSALILKQQSDLIELKNNLREKKWWQSWNRWWLKVI